MRPTPTAAANFPKHDLRSIAARQWLDPEEIDEDAADEHALVRLIQTQGTLTVDAWAFDAD